MLNACRKVILATLLLTGSAWVNSTQIEESWPASNATADSEELAAQRANIGRLRNDFLRMEKLVWKTSDEEFADMLKTLGDYPLVPYLIERKLLHNLQVKKEPQIKAFLEQYEGTRLERRVRRPWLTHLAKYNRKDLFVQYYRPLGNTKLECRFLRYQLEDASVDPSIDTDAIAHKAAELWNVGQSQHKECDPVFKHLKRSGKLTEDLILQRIQKSADGGQHTLIPYLKTLLPSDKQYLADLWRLMRRDPANVRSLSKFTGKYQAIEAEIARYALGRLIWRDEKLALSDWEKAKNKLVFNNQQLGYIAGRFAISLAIDDHPQAEAWLIKAEGLNKDPEILRWHMAYLLRHKNWTSLINLIEKSAPELTSQNEYQYWLARAYEITGNQSKATTLYTQLAQQRHYYGFLSSARLQIPISLQNSPIVPSEELLQKVMDHPSAKRALELRAIERYHEARLEWRTLQSQLTDDEAIVAAVVASEQGWHDQAIFGFSDTGYLDDIDRRFPTAYEKIIVSEATRNKVKPEWAFAIARRESSFMSDAVSPADARGLMQLLPSTAKYLEKKRVSSRNLLNPRVNAKIGNKYLRYLMDKLDDNSILATASYNAGWRRVKQWLPEDSSIEADLWIETIPFKETRNYVKAVMAYKQIYHERLNRAQLNSGQMKAVSAFNDVIDTQIPVSI